MGEDGTEITSLYIDVETNAEEAERQLYSLHDTIRSMKGAGRGSDVSLKEVSREAKKATSHTKGLLSQIAKIGKTMIIRSALRGVLKAAKDGYQNLLLYSQAINSADSSRAASTANAYASALTQCKNAAGAAIAPLAEALLPVVQTLSGWFVAAANAVNQFISALMGKSTYTKALGVAVDYVGELESGAGGANESLKELKKTILGFDEINALNDTSKTGGRGGGGGGVSVGDMFEEAEIDSNISKVAEKVREVFEKIKEYAEPVLNWINENVDSTALIIAGLAASIASLSGNFKVGVGIALSIIGLSMEYDAIKNIASGNGELKDYIKAAIGAALGVSGALLVFGTGPLGWTIGLGAVLTIGISAVINSAKEMQDTAEALSRTGDAYERILGIMNESGGIFQESLAILGSIEICWNNIDKAAKNAALSQLYALQTKALANAQEAAYQYDIALQELEIAEKNLQKAQNGSKQEVLNAEAAYNRAAEAVFAAENALRTSDTAITNATEYIETLRNEIDKTSLTWDSYVVNADGSSTLISDVYKNIQDSAKETAGATKMMRDEAKRHLENFTSDVNYTKRRYGDFQKEVDTKSNIIAKSLEKVRDGVKLTKDEIDRLIKSIKQNAQLDIKVRAAKGSGQNYVENFASGGYPKGDVFVANENGPELVGTVNGRPAVASNNEITGITYAVNESSAREALLLNALINLVKAILEKDNGGGIITTEQIYAAMSRQNRRDGTSTFAVVT